MKVKKRFDAFVNAVTGLGTSGDKAMATEIAPTRPLDLERLEDLYRSSAYAAVLVDELVFEATRKGWTVNINDRAGVCEDFDDDWDMRDMVVRAATMGRLLGGAVVFAVINDGHDPSEEFDADRPFELLNFVVLDRREISALTWDTDVTSRTFGQPLTWLIQPRSGGQETGRVVHASRVVYFGGAKVSRQVRIEQQGFDDSILRRALPAIRNKTSIDQSRAHIVQDFKTDILKTANLDTIGTADEQLDYFEQRTELIARSKSNINMVLLDAGEDFQKTSTSVAGLADLDSAAIEELTTAARMPRTRFTGEAPGGLSTDGSSQITNWNSQVASFQTNELRKSLVKIYRYVLGASNGPCKGRMPKKWHIEFCPLDEPSEFQKAALRKTVAETDVMYLDRGVLSAPHVAEERFGEGGWSFDMAPPEPVDDDPVLAVAAAVHTGVLDRAAARMTLESAFGLSPEEINDLLPSPTEEP